MCRIYIFIGFKNQWGALLEQQEEIQSRIEEQEKNIKQARSNKYKEELEAQLKAKKHSQILEKQIKYNPKEKKLLSDDYK